MNSWKELFTVWTVRGAKDSIIGYYIFHITGNRSWASYDLFKTKEGAELAAEALFKETQRDLEKILLG